MDPPPSLFKALRIFLVGVAEGLREAELEFDVWPQNRSMLVHPSRLVDDHKLYTVRIKAALTRWSAVA